MKEILLCIAVFNSIATLRFLLKSIKDNDKDGDTWAVISAGVTSFLWCCFYSM